MKHCPYCHTNYEPEFIDVCAMCESPEIGEKGNGDESLTICDDCRAVEQGYKQAEVCPNCETVIQVSVGRRF